MEQGFWTTLNVVRTGIEMDKNVENRIVWPSRNEEPQNSPPGPKMRRKYPGNEIVLLGQNCWRCSRKAQLHVVQIDAVGAALRK